MGYNCKFQCVIPAKAGIQHNFSGFPISPRAARGKSGMTKNTLKNIWAGREKMAGDRGQKRCAKPHRRLFYSPSPACPSSAREYPVALDLRSPLGEVGCHGDEPPSLRRSYGESRWRGEIPQRLDLRSQSYSWLRRSASPRRAGGAGCPAAPPATLPSPQSLRASVAGRSPRGASFWRHAYQNLPCIFT